MKKLEKIFTNSKVMITCGILSALIYFFGYVPYYFDQEHPYFKFDFIPSSMFALAIILLIIAYKKGEINIQKTLMGALLFYFAQETFSSGFWYFESYFTGYEESLLYPLFYTVIGICEYGIFFSHLLLQSDHSGNNILFKLNQILSLIVVAGYIFYIIQSTITYGFDLNFFDNMVYFSESLFILMIVCMETKIQIYKRTRTKAISDGNWNEETKLEARKIFSK